MKINISSRQKDFPIDKPFVRRLTKEVLALEGWKTDEISLNFVTTEEICQLHADFFDDPSTTDCITFPMDGRGAEGYHVLGEAFICPATALRYSEEHQIDLEWEVYLYIIHCLLHLMGYEDTSPKKRAIMRTAERKHIDNLRQKGLRSEKDS